MLSILTELPLMKMAALIVVVDPEHDCKPLPDQKDSMTSSKILYC